MQGSRTTRRLKGLLATVALVAAITVPVALASAPAVQVLPGQRIDLKVLLVSADGTEPGFGAWQAELRREGVPFDTLVSYTGQAKTATLTDARLADYAANHANYQAVILASGDLGHNVSNPDGTVSYLSAFTDAEWATLASYERTFGIRQLSDYTAPSPAHGLIAGPGATQDGVVGTLTPAGKAAFPYLKGPVPIANDDPTVAETFGYPATPVNAQDWQTLLAGPGGTAFLGIYTHPDDGREEMVMTVASNQFQSHNQLLRHGMLNWVTRGVFLGYQRNYLELDVDDLFLGDDAWDPATHTTDYDPVAASRMTPADVDQAIAWSRAHGLRLDFAFNGGGSALYEEDHGTTDDPLADKFRQPAVSAAFGFVNHTYDHPNLDCSTPGFITREITTNLAWARANGIPVSSAAELVTGEHSGLANLRPGNPGTIDPPSFDDVSASPTGGAIPGGTYDYAITASSPAGETVASIEPGVVTTGTTSSVTAAFDAVCHAVTYTLYRSPAGAGTWSRVGTLGRSGTAATDDGRDPIILRITDTAVSGPAATPPTANGAALAPYGQNPSFASGLSAAGIGFTASDASKPYPSSPLVVDNAPLAAGDAFSEGGLQVVPRYPTNVYYNTSRQGQQLDEYNWLYVDSAHGGGCVPVAGVTTCRTTPATWAEYVAAENLVMFRHVVGNDPRAHFIHQSNLADYNPALPETDPNQGGVLYPVLDGLLAGYESTFDRASEPLLQLSETQIGQTLAQQSAWAAALAAGTVTAWLQDGRVHVRNAGATAVDVPVTGTTVGSLYGGQTSGWTPVPAGAEPVLTPSDPANASAPSISGTARRGETLTAANGVWTGTPAIGYDYRWQRCDRSGVSCATVACATSTTYTLGAADVGSRLRVIVLAGNWISSVSQAASAPTAVVSDAAAVLQPGSKPSTPSKPGAHKVKRLTLTKVKMAPRRFAVAHRKPRRGTRLDGSRITWRLSLKGTVRLTVQRNARTARHPRWVTVEVITRSAKAGNGTASLTGRYGRHRRLSPRHYRLVAVAHKRGHHSTAAKRIAFRVVKG